MLSKIIKKHPHKLKHGYSQAYLILVMPMTDGNHHDSMLPFPLQFLEYAEKYFAACLNW